MTLLEQLRKDKMMALKEKDTIKNGVTSLLIASIGLALKENPELSEQDALGYVQKELKQTRETLNLTPSDRADSIEEAKRKIEILESYLPKQLTHDEIIHEIQVILQEENLEPILKNQGTIMKAMMAKFKGQTDGKTVGNAVKEILK